MDRHAHGKVGIFTRREIVLVAAMMIAVLFTQGSTAWGSGSGPAASPPQPGTPYATCPQGGQCFADVPADNSFYTFVNRIYQQDLVTGYPCGGAGEPCDQYNRPYYRPANGVTRAQMSKFIDNARTLPQININTSTDAEPIRAFSTALNSIGIHGTANYVGVYGQTSADDGYGILGGQSSAAPGATGAAIRASANAAYGIVANSQTNVAVLAQSSSGIGVSSQSTSNIALRGLSTSGYGVYGQSSTSYGVSGVSVGGSYGVYGQSASGDGVHASSTSGYGIYATSGSNYAGWFQGNVNVTGTCCQSAEATLRIDDPTDPANRYLDRAAVESSDLLGIYRGHVTLDAQGEAWVALPSWFESLYGDFDYQLTCVGAYAPVYIAQEISNNQFRIAGGKAGLKVSWQVTGVRHDAYAQQHPVTPQQEKPASEQGTYIHPELYGQTAAQPAP